MGGSRRKTATVPGLIAAMVAGLAASAPAPAQDANPASASCGAVLATIPILATEIQARTEESFLAQLARFDLAPGVTGTAVFACLCRQDPHRQFRAVIDTMAQASRDELGLCLDEVAAAARPEILTVRPSTDRIGDLPVLLGPGEEPADPGLWDAYSDGDLRALLRLDPVDLATSLDTNRGALRAELERRLLARLQAAGPDAPLSETDLQFVLEARIRGAGHAMADVLSDEIQRRHDSPTAIVRGDGGGRGGRAAVDTPAADVAARFAGWSDAALLGLADLETDQVEALTGRPRRAALEELVWRALQREGSLAALPDDAGPAGVAGDIAVVHGAPAADAPAAPAHAPVRTDVQPQTPNADAGTARRLAACLEGMPTDELALTLSGGSEALEDACATIPQ